MEYHPHSGHVTSIDTFFTFRYKEHQQSSVINDEPWQPFSCRADFELAELAHQATLNKNQTDELLWLIWRIADGQAKFTLKSHGNVLKAWNRAAGQMTPFEKHTITVQHKCEDLKYDVYTWLLWDWALDLLQDPLLAPHFFWMHSNGLGGGQMVGWLPIVPDNSDEDGKLTYVNLKCVIWHKAFFKLLETIIIYAETGYVYMCYDSIMRWLYVFILLLLADYKEQCMMVLIRGTNCHCPYAKALVELWTRDHVAGEKTPKEQGLRPIENVFWKVPNSNPHYTISQDHLHVYHMGQWKHLFGELKQCLAALGCNADKKLDDHDGNKLQDISKQILYAAQNILTRTADEVGYALLQCIASYLHIDMYISLKVQTESTIAAGRAEVLEFQNRLEEYIKIVKKTEPDMMKNWNFPKIHSGKHIFNNIMAKGTARNVSTRPNEKQHGPIKCWYLWQTNHKDITNQILELNHRSIVSEFICSHIECLDEARCKLILSQEELKDMDEDDEPFEEHFHLNSPLKNHTTLAQLEEENKSICVFHQFWKKLATFLNHFLPSHNTPLPEKITWLRLSAQDRVNALSLLLFKSDMMLNYESTADWKLATDYLRSNASFHGKEQHDCALIHTQDKDGHDKNIIYSIGDRTLDLVLVLPIDALIGPRWRMDQEL
ncbi:uncharacterized protein F5891DRAFT_1129601 [Suillus fuscotomentosus]|uniref:Uncharacterized protein n=1 Tax=Suillus fuscotomentosus TaxID=1912939 RepID=A0AAD4E455_9AGAM|nr:uncharacterized protein F5891DRAFT_1129601 [Suillus fuscotomentosus]KAG1898174.1 hypothetical protein F5891DRAFT_1129601 [Suillus fuscotomentosus]